MSAREEAIEVMAGTLGRHGVASINFVHWTKTCRCGWVRKVGPDGMTADEWDEAHHLHRMEEALDAILAPRIEKGPIAYLAANLIPVVRARVKNEKSGVPIGWRLGELIEPLYRLPDESPKGGA